MKKLTWNDLKNSGLTWSLLNDAGLTWNDLLKDPDDLLIYIKDNNCNVTQLFQSKLDELVNRSIKIYKTYSDLNEDIHQKNKMSNFEKISLIIMILTTILTAIPIVEELDSRDTSNNVDITIDIQNNIKTDILLIYKQIHELNKIK